MMTKLYQPNPQVSEIGASGLFDGQWYAVTNPDVRAAGVDPLTHWVTFGSREGRKPNQYFEPRWYFGCNPIVAAAGLDPLTHYLRHGEKAGRWPSPNFDPEWYRTAYPIPRGSSALGHFLANRLTGRFAPRADLYAVCHLPAYQSEIRAGRDPFARALEDAAKEERHPYPDVIIVAATGLLDPDFYLVNGTDVAQASLDPVQHFCRFGWQEGRKPNMYFDTEWYRRTNPQVAHIGINPLIHYIVEGEKAGRRPIIYFDPEWYKKVNSLADEESALAHYLVHRRIQTYSPTPMFDVRWYVDRSGADIGSNRDPFAHYLRAGAKRDLDPSPSFDAAAYRRLYLGRPSRVFHNRLRPDSYSPLVHYLHTRYC